MPAGPLPAWSALSTLGARRLPVRWPTPPTRQWAWEGSTGRGARVCIVDSGIETGHPLVGAVDSAVAVEVGEDDEPRIVEDQEGDVAGHGTACAGIIRALAPDCALHSVRVLGPRATGSGSALLAGVAWAIEQNFDVVNLSVSTRRRDFAMVLHDLADAAYFQRTVLVASAHNLAVESFPWRFASVVSVGSHETEDPRDFRYNARPPVEFYARGSDIKVAWLGGGTTVTTGNSFATAHLSGICAQIVAKHPGLTPFELKSVLYLTASNVGPAA